MKTGVRRLAMAAALTVLTAATAWSQTPASQAPPPDQAASPGGRGRAGACRADVKRFCADETPGGGRIVACLRDHRAELSDGCKSALMNARRNREGKAAGAGEPLTPPPPNR